MGIIIDTLEKWGPQYFVLMSVLIIAWDEFIDDDWDNVQLIKVFFIATAVNMMIREGIFSKTGKVLIKHR